MTAIKKFFAVSIFAAAGVVNAATTYNVNFVFESPVVFGGSSNIPVTGGGTGIATLDDNGVLLMNVHGEGKADLSALFGAPRFADAITDSIVQLITTSSAPGTYNLTKTASALPLQTSSYNMITSCSYGPLDTNGGCDAYTLNQADPLSGTDSFYTAQSFTLNGGTIRVMTTTTGFTSIADYTLTAVPLPASAGMFASSLLGLSGLARRRKIAH